jgi:putative oxidoreductase
MTVHYLEGKMSGILEPLVGYTSYLALLLRLFFGVSLVIHGYPKVKGGWRQSGQWMKSMGIPAFTAVAATIIEFFGGILLIIGLIVPVVSAFAALEFAAIIIMKMSKMHARYVSFEQGKPTYEIDVFYLVLALVLFVLGAGALSLDNLLGV